MIAAKMDLDSNLDSWGSAGKPKDSLHSLILKFLCALLITTLRFMPLVSILFLVAFLSWFLKLKNEL